MYENVKKEYREFDHSGTLMHVYLKITVQIKSRVWKRSSDYLSLTQPEFHCVYTKSSNNDTMKPKQTKNLSIH